MTLFTAIFTTHLICATCNDGLWHENKLVGAQVDGYTAAIMTNSYDRPSLVFGYDFSNNPSYGIIVGAATGYNEIPISNGGLMPFVAPYFKYGPARAILFGDALAFTIEFDI